MSLTRIEEKDNKESTNENEILFNFQKSNLFKKCVKKYYLIKIKVTRQSTALCSATWNTMSRKLGEKWRMNRDFVHILLWSGLSMKLKKNVI